MSTWNKSLLATLLLICTVNASSLLEGIYCGKENCYDVLKVKRDSSKQDIVRAYRAQAKIYHPDMHRGEDAKKIAEEKFKEIATAYEILRDEDSRNDYDYMLDNPSAYYSHYYNYYRRRVSPKIDIRLVIIVTISIISIIQYYTAHSRYDDAINYFTTVQKYRNKAMEMGKDDIDKISKRGKVKTSKAEQKQEIEKIIRKIIEEKMDIQGAYAKPQIIDILWIQILILPYTICKYILWYVRWVWKFNILKRPYGDEEKLYIIRKFMKIGKHQFDAKSADEKEEYLDLELYNKEKFVEWKTEQEEEQKKLLAENPRYKQYRRYMKNRGPGRITFED